jgi:hypothetical protein
VQGVAVLIRQVICPLIYHKPKAQLCVICFYFFLGCSHIIFFQPPLPCVQGAVQGIFNDIKDLMEYITFVLGRNSGSALNTSLLMAFSHSFHIALDMPGEMSAYIIWLFDRYLE